MIFGDLVDVKLPNICRTGEEKPENSLARKFVPTGDRTRACITAMNEYLHHGIDFIIYIQLRAIFFTRASSTYGANSEIQTQSSSWENLKERDL